MVWRLGSVSVHLLISFSHFYLVFSLGGVGVRRRNAIIIEGDDGARQGEAGDWRRG